MSEVKRLGLDMDYPFQYREDAEGNLCYYADYAALKAERDALAAENAALKVLADACSREYESPKTEACDDDEKVAYPEEQCNITFGMIRSAARTPATDAYLNSVRAEGVDMFISELAELFKTLKTGGKPWQAVKGIAMRAASFAAQLRAGEPS